jgi:pyruvate dehydrogenase E2 component (dihydrolipoamide acetyltransferase)
VAEIPLPQLGESVTEGVITQWLVAVGDTVAVDQPLVEISTDKVDTEIPSPVAGVVTELRAAVDETVDVGQVIVVVTEGADGAAPAAAPAAPAPAATPAPAAPAAPAATVTPAAPAATTPAVAAPAPPARAPVAPAASAPRSAAGIVASPLVRRLLADAGLSAADLTGTGPGGRVTREDAERAIAAGVRPAGAGSRGARPGAPVRERPEASPVQVDFGSAREVVQPLERIRKAIASSMLRSLQTTAQLTAAVEVDMTAIMRLRESAKDAFRAAHGVGLSPFTLIARAVCAVLPRHPALNASIDTEAGTVTYHGFVNLGIAVDTDRGLLVPNIKDAQRLDVPGMARAIADAAERSRAKQLTPDDIGGGTFTVTNTGSRGTLFDTPILNPPEAAILATCAIEKRPVVVDDGMGDAIAIRWMSYLCLTYDHRLIDGADAARFLADLKYELEVGDPSAELGIAIA